MSLAQNPSQPITAVLDERYWKQDRHIGIRWGIVTAPPSQDPKKVDRIQFWTPPWPKHKHSDWTQMLNFGQGDKCGIFMPPRVGDRIMLMYMDGNPNNPYYITLPSLKCPPPEEHIDGKPEDRWMIRTLRGHLIEYFDDPLEQKIELHSIAGHYVILDDVNGRRKLKLCDCEGRYICLDTENGKIEAQDLAHNVFRMRDKVAKDIQLIHGNSESFLWMKENGDIHINAQEELNLTAKTIRHWASQKTIDHVPETTVTCIEDGKDFVTCGAVRTSECYDCEKEEGTGETPPSGDPAQQYEFTQTTPASEWTVNHGKGKYPQVTIIDDDGFVVDAPIQHISKNQTKIYFNEPVVGKAICD